MKESIYSSKQQKTGITLTTLERLEVSSTEFDSDAGDNVLTQVPPELLRMKSFPLLYPAERPLSEAECRYTAQLFFAGPDAAIVARNGELYPCLDGVRSGDAELKAVVEGYREAVLNNVEMLQEHQSDTVILAGTWMNVDCNEAPRFEACLIHILSVDGRLRTRRYNLEIFDWDTPEEGIRGTYSFSVVSASELLRSMRVITENIVQRDALADIMGEEFPIAGVVWTPSRAELPVIVCRAVGKRRFKIEDRLQNTDRLLPEERDALRAIDRLVELSGLPSSATVLEQLNNAYQLLAKSIETMDAETAEYLADTALEALASTSFGLLGGQIVDRQYRDEEISLTEVVNSTPAVGAWLQYRDADQALRAGQFYRFSSAYRTGKIHFSDATMRVAEEPVAGIAGARYLSDWVKITDDSDMMLRTIVVDQEPKVCRDL